MLRARGGRLACRVAAAGAGIGLCLLLGCNVAPVASRDNGARVGDLGESWDVTLGCPEASAMELAAGPGPEYARLDGKLGVGAYDSGYPLNQWPRVDAPSLDRPGYVYIPRNPGVVTYFRRR